MRAIARDGTVTDVVFDFVVVGEQPAAVGERQEERGDGERDDDGGQRQRLRNGSLNVERARAADDRRVAAPARRDQQDVAAVGQ